MTKILFVDTHSIYQAQEGKRDVDGLRPIIVYDMGTDEVQRAATVEINGKARVCFEMTPAHNLARVWIEAEDDALDYDGEETTWDGRRDQ